MFKENLCGSCLEEIPLCHKQLGNSIACEDTLGTNYVLSPIFISVPPSSGIFVQAGAFSRYENANKLRALLSKVGNAKIYQVKVSKQPFFRVRLGPASSVDEADKMLARIVASGYADARIIVD